MSEWEKGICVGGPYEGVVVDINPPTFGGVYTFLSARSDGRIEEVISYEMTDDFDDEGQRVLTYAPQDN